MEKMNNDQIVLASSNAGKLREVAKILEGTGLSIVPLSETSFQGEIDENGETFEENALIKARCVSQALGMPALADDSGLEIDAMGKEPGVHSARFMGHDTSYDIKNAEILRRLSGLPAEERTARFVCAMALVWPGREEKVVKETMEGQIAFEPAGENGFGYDPIFFLPQYGMTSGQLSTEGKNAISHRGKALRKMAETIRQMQEEQ